MANVARGDGPKSTVVDSVRQQLLELIDKNNLRPGDRLEPEPRLAEKLGVSRSSIREAFRILENDGVVTAVQGHGRFLTSAGTLGVDRPMSKFESLTETLSRLGYRVTTAVLSVEETTSRELESAALDIPVGTPVIRLIRLRLGDDKPMVVNINTIPREYLPGPPTYRDWSGSLTEMLASHNHRVSFSAAHISAGSLPKDIEERFNLANLGPWLLVRETGIDIAGNRVFCGEDYHTSDISFSILRHR